MQDNNTKARRKPIDIDFISAIENNIRAIRVQLYCLETSELIEFCSAPDMLGDYLNAIDREAENLLEAFKTIEEDLIANLPNEPKGEEDKQIFKVWTGAELIEANRKKEAEGK